MNELKNPQVDVMPRKASDLFLFMVRPYKARTFFFFLLSNNHHLTQAIWYLVAFYFVLRIIDEVLWRVAEALMRSYKPQMIERIRSMLFGQALKKSYGYSVNASSGRIGHWINRTTSTANDVVDTTIWAAWSRVIGLIISAVFLFIINWMLGLLFIVWLILLFLFTTYRGKRFGQLVAIQSDEESKASAVVVDALSNHLSVRVYNAQEREKLLLYSRQQHIVRRWRDSWQQNLLTNIVKGQSAAIVSSIALVLVLVLYGNGAIQIGGILLFAAYFGDASSSQWELAWSLDSYYRNFGTIQNALDGLDGEDARQGESIPLSDLPKKINLKLENLSFAYSDQHTENVLQSLNLEILNGQKVGIVGHSGAGKSTLVGLLLGFYEPSKGRILINDVDITSKDPSFSRAVSSFVPQDANLFNRTIRENVVYARPTATEAELKAALSKAKALDFVEKLPKGLDTLIGERGIKLSGGQRQRIAIARAILKDAPLLLLDEATSALDSVSEQAIQKALHELMQNRTSLVIAHRLSTLKHLDKIIVIENGRIAEEGSHDELVKKAGIYADLWKRQKDGFIVD
jgi:ATP-binding cassette subfamily B protein